MEAQQILPAATEEIEKEPDPVPSQEGQVPRSMSEQEPVPSTSQEQGDSKEQEDEAGNKDDDGGEEEELSLSSSEEEEDEEEEEVVVAVENKEEDRECCNYRKEKEGEGKVRGSAVPPPNRVKALYKDHQDLNVIFGILFASLAVLRWCEGRAEFHSAATLIGLLVFIVRMLVWALPQSMISRNYAGLENYMSTAAVVLDVYVALLMVNIQYIIIVIIPLMIFIFIGALAWKSRETGVSQYKKYEEILSAKNLSSESSVDLVFFEAISHFLQLSLVAWTQYKGEQGCTPILSDFLLFLGSALGALGAMLASPLAGFDSRAVSIQVLPVLHKTCTVLLFIAVHTLAAEWLEEDMIFVCLPELIAVLVWFSICFGQAMSVSSSMSLKSQVIIGSVVGMLVCLTSWQANDKNMHVSCIVWVSWVSLSSSALSGFHAWLLHGWPGRSSESNKLIHLLIVASTVGSSAAVILCVSLMLTNPSILHESIYSFQYKTITTVLSVFCSYLLYSYASCRHGHLKTQIQRALEMKYSVVGKVCTHMLVKKLYARLDELVEEINPSRLFYESQEWVFALSMQQVVQKTITLFESSSHVMGRSRIGLIHDLACEIEDWADICSGVMNGRMNAHQHTLSINPKTGRRMDELKVHLLCATDIAPANPVCLLIPRDKILKTLDKILQAVFKLASIVGIRGSEVQYMKSVIKDRYYQLDVELKMCLLYLSIFPVRQVIEVERLVRLWIAEGFIYGQYHPTTDQEKVGIAEGYIRELVRTDLIMHSSKGMKRTISIHPVIHSFIVSMSMEENFVTLVHSQEDVSPFNGTARRLSLLNNGKDQAAGGSYWKELRSVTVFNNTSGIALLAEMTRLHVLDLEGCKGPVCLDDLGQLFLLRYLGLKGTDVSELPAQIGELSCLETLDVRSTKVKEIPPSIIRLQKLMHLLAGNAKLPSGIGKMKMLFALSCQDVNTDSTSIIQELSKIDNLTELELICESGEVVAFKSDRFHSLHKLSVQFGYPSLPAKEKFGYPSLIFKTGALPNVQFLGLNLDKGLPKGSTGVAGIEHLRSLENVHIKYSRDDPYAEAVVAQVESYPWCPRSKKRRPLVTEEVDEELIVPRSWRSRGGARI
ncbi:hypothetical protein ACQJBY_013080 [Aegilops geniculata]